MHDFSFLELWKLTNYEFIVSFDKDLVTSVIRQGEIVNKMKYLGEKLHVEVREENEGVRL